MYNCRTGTYIKKERQWIYVATYDCDFLILKIWNGIIYPSLIFFISLTSVLLLSSFGICTSAAEHQQSCPSGTPSSRSLSHLHVRHGQALRALSRQQKRHLLNLIGISCTNETLPKAQRAKRGKQGIKMFWNWKLFLRIRLQSTTASLSPRRLSCSPTNPWQRAIFSIKILCIEILWHESQCF